MMGGGGESLTFQITFFCCRFCFVSELYVVHGILAALYANGWWYTGCSNFFHMVRFHLWWEHRQIILKSWRYSDEESVRRLTLTHWHSGGRRFGFSNGGPERERIKKKTELQIEPRGWSAFSWYSTIGESAGEAWKENPERSKEIAGFLWEIYKWGGGVMGLEGLNSWGWGKKVEMMRAKSRKKRGFWRLYTSSWPA